MAGRTTPKSHKAEPSALIALSLLSGADPGHLSQQVTSSQDQEPLGSCSLSEVGSEFLPFFHTHEQPLAMEELAQQCEVCPGHKDGWSPREGLFFGEPAPPSGFFPYYRSPEEHLPSTTSQGCWCLGTRDLFPTVRDGCCKSALAGPELLSGFSPLPACCHFLGGFVCDSNQNLPLSGDHALGASGFVPYYRSPEESLHTSLEPPSPVLGGSRE